MLIKCDDDIVWFSDWTRFAAFLRYRRKHAEDVFLLSANVVNNGVCAHLQHAAGCLPDDTFGAAYPDGGFSGALWASADAALALHKAFLRDPACVLAMRGAVQFHHRLSINFIALMGRHLPWAVELINSAWDLGDGVGGGGGVDEHVLTAVSGHKYGARNEVFAGFAVAHATFGKQRAARDAVIELYRSQVRHGNE